MLKLPNAKIKTDAQNNTDNRVLLESPVSDFIPYACHYDKDTILTKDGALLQTINIEEFSSDHLDSNTLGLREQIRQLLAKTIQSSNFALYFHTIRRRKTLDVTTQLPSLFATNLHNGWVKQNDWDQKFITEVYITVVRRGIPISVKLSNFFKMFMLSPLVKKHDNALKLASEELSSITDKIKTALSQYGATKLTLKQDTSTGGYHSELLRFFASIIHLDKSDVSLPLTDLSTHLAKYKIAFGNNALEVKGKSGKSFATMLSLKRYDSVSPAAIDKLLQFPAQFIVTQALTFTPVNTALKAYKYQNYILGISQDTTFENISGIDRFFNTDKEYTETSFCTSQATIMLIENQLDTLLDTMQQMNERLVEVGIPAVREDVNMEHCFWSQLPGNFNYLVRKNIMASSDVASFATIGNFPFGSLKSKWGKHIALMTTSIGTAYFFNFHVGNNGHTIIVGNAESTTHELFNFLLSEATKFNPKIMYLDSNRHSEVYVKALNGQYKIISFDPSLDAIKFNPLLLEDNQANRNFLVYWFMFLLDKYSDSTDISLYINVAKKAVEIIFTLPSEQRRLANVSKFFVDPEYEDLNKKIILDLMQWYGEGKFAHIFDNTSDEFATLSASSFLGLDLTEVYEVPVSMNLPIYSYILHYFKCHYTSTNPSILAVASGNSIFNSLYFEKNLEYILTDLEKLNAVVLVNASFRSERVNWSAIVGQIYDKKMATKLFGSDSAAYENVERIFSLSSEDKMYMQALDNSGTQYVIQQAGKSVLVNVDLSKLPESGILSHHKNIDKIAKNIIAAKGDDPKLWLEEFYKKSTAQEH